MDRLKIVKLHHKLEAMSISNKKTYESQDVVSYYYSRRHLYKPEETILNSLKSKLKDMKMLDIGVGAGRTSYHFANLTKEYTGIDYSENMINVCKKEFSELNKNIYFKVCDVRAMEIFKDNYFDFILFSFNGIDCISYEDRLKALHEIKRVCKKAGVFCFSTHNLRSIDKLLKINLSKNLFKMAKRILKHFVIRLLNEDFKKLKNKKCAIITDGDQRFRLICYYIKPEEQIKQLSNLGFKNIKIYSFADGKEIENKSKLDTITDSWLYYLCNT